MNSPRNSLKWKILNRRTVVKDRWIDLEASECELPGGMVIAPFYVTHSCDFAVVVAVTQDEQVLVEWQYRHGVEDVILELPAGAMEPGEKGEDAARRELREETGYEAGELEFLCKIAPNASSNSNFAWCYLARNVAPAGAQQLDETESLEVAKLPLSEVRQLLDAGEFLQAVHMAALYRALQVL